jgi:NAD(P)-dependent dehydrogenase (short-subunit alcohol dehydrogenase family)
MDAAIVTGVSRGLGKALAATLLERGFTVLGVGRSSPTDLKGTYEFVRFDLAEAADTDERLTAAFSGLASRAPKSVCLVNNAALGAPIGTLGRLQAREIAASLAVNLAAVVTLANLFCRVFTDASIERRIINVSSGAAQNALPGDSVYCVAKAGMEMLTRTLAAEQKHEGFRAITVRPGVIDTDMQAFARSQSPDVLPSVELFKGFYREGRLVPPDVVAAKIVDKLILGEVEHGRTYSYAEL